MRGKILFMKRGKIRVLFLLLFPLALCLSAQAYAQGSPLDIINTDVFRQEEINGRVVRKLLHNVHLRQDSTDFFCDSAYHYVDSNIIFAYSRVKILMSRKISLYADRLTYDGETKIANLYNNITLRDSAVTLRTNRLTYYRKEDYGKYFTGGTLENGSNVLTSKEGYYYPGQKMAYFKRNVKLVSQDETDTVPDYTLLTDTLGYNTDAEIAYFLAPTTVTGSANNIYTEGGYYDTKNKEAYFTKRAHLADTAYSIYGDTIYYDQGTDRGHAEGHIILLDKDSSLTIYGNKAEFESDPETSYITDSCYAIQILEGDTLYLFSDTLRVVDDSLKGRIFYSYYDVKIFMNGLQGICDSLVYLYEDSTILFFRDPVLWSEENQILGDTVKIFLKKSQIDSMSIPLAPFLITQEDTVGFDQIKGKALQAKFLDNKIFRMWISGNTESIYYAKDDKDVYMGMNRAKCKEMKVNFAENKPSRILFAGQPEGSFSPMHEVLFKENKLEGFVWRAEERPEKPEGLYMVHPSALYDALVGFTPDRVLNVGAELRIPDLTVGFTNALIGSRIPGPVPVPKGFFFVPKEPEKGTKTPPEWETMSKWEKKAYRRKMHRDRKTVRAEDKKKRKEERAKKKLEKRKAKATDTPATAPSRLQTGEN